MRPHKRTTSTTLVLEALMRADDFRTARQLVVELRSDTNHVSAALHHLRKHNAVECMTDGDTLWWYATQDQDRRMRKVHERAPEVRPRKPRGKRNQPERGEKNGTLD